MSINTDILIIGGGVAGSALACGLRRKGYRVVLIEKSNKPQDTARGDHLQPYVCEIL
ncbi:MAG TPA: FAD-dependent oxidoreductase, partial [Gammaproteobacteria bacterium]|nr:FAD-dependent oxidoreductase [Gammaproteobacteria bacterium]